MNDRLVVPSGAGAPSATTRPALAVLADDRTGALETAGACAEAGWEAVVVSVHGDALPAEVVVTDLGSRHLDPVSAAGVATDAARTIGAAAFVHKIDSTLRGNWAVELLALHVADGRPVLCVPSFPAAGRTCRGGIVFDHGRPVAEGPAGRDPIRPVRSSRPADHLAVAASVLGVPAPPVVSLSDPPSVAAWLDDPRGIAVADALDEATIDAYAHAWAGNNIRLAGTAAVIGAAARALGTRHRSHGRARSHPAGAHGPQPGPLLPRPALVVCGSLHPASRAQIGELTRDGWRTIVVADHATATEPIPTDGDAVVVCSDPRATGRDPQAVASALAVLTREWLDVHRGRGTLVLLGGDTAAAVLGDRPRRVGGLLAPGVPWCPADGGFPLVVSKPGGFGHPGMVRALFTEPAGSVPYDGWHERR